MSNLITKVEHIDLSVDELIQHALERKEGVLSANGAFTALTGSRTGRSPKDRFVVEDDVTKNTVDWGVINQPISPATFQALWARVSEFLADKETFVSHLQVGANESYAIPVKVINQVAWHNAFAHNMFIDSQKLFQEGRPHWTILSAPWFEVDPARDGVRSDAALLINFSERKILMAGLRYGGEMKKAMFGVMNFLMPDRDVLPMHCAANVGEEGDSALFFGLSGTGKTTLSADPDRYLIGDDEHGWSRDGIFNFEGGCYAKCINLSQKTEPMIWDAIRHGAIMENVYLDENGVPDYTDDRYTQNTRVVYPLTHIDKRIVANQAGIPKAVIFLTCDLYGVLPPVSLLSKEQAAYHFLSGYTALVGSTEVGSTAAISSTFSRCFGAPFFPRPASVYAELLMKRIEESGAQVYLINTGWTGGSYGKGGKRFDIPTTRAVVSAALSGKLVDAETTVLPGFNLKIPTHIPGVDDKALDPRKNWSTQEAYQESLRELVGLFKDNFTKFTVTDAIRQAGPVDTE